MMKIRFLTLAALALLLGACTQDELADGSRLSKEEYPIVIHATGLSVEATPQAAPSTRATVDGNWQGVTSVALKLGDAVKEYTVTATDADGYKSATLSRENDPYYWTSRDPITVSAWWPLDNTDITQMPVVKVAEDQSKLADFQKSDGSCNILRFSQIRSGTLTEEDITYILIQVVQCSGSKYQSRSYGVATDVFLSHLSSDIFRQVDDTRFAGAV